MNNLLSRTKEEVRNIILRAGPITLANLECSIDTSFNLLFLAIEKLISENKIKIRRGEWDYIFSIYDNPDNPIEEKTNTNEPSSSA